MSHTITSQSQATNRSSCHASRRYQQITCSKSCFLPRFLQIPANHRQQAVHVAMPPTDTSKSETKSSASCHVPHNTDTSKSQAANSTSYHALHRYPGQQILHLTMLHTGTSKSQATSGTSFNSSHRYQHQRQQTVHLAMPHTATSESQAAKHTSCHASHRYQTPRNGQHHDRPKP